MAIAFRTQVLRIFWESVVSKVTGTYPQSHTRAPNAIRTLRVQKLKFQFMLWP